MKHSMLVLISLVVSLCFTPPVVDANPWYVPSSLAKLNASALHPHLELLLNASILSYISTWGSYFEPWSVNATLHGGWIRGQGSSLESNPPEGGMRALTFIHHPSNRILIAFRGTDLDLANISGQCDMCADTFLWGGVPYKDLPFYCRQFTPGQIDYFSRAMNFSRGVAQQFPSNYEILYTGHSLGAGLASLMTMVSLTKKTPSSLVSRLVTRPSSEDCSPHNTAGAVVFSSPNFILPLQNRTQVPLDREIYENNVVVFADEFDPVYVYAVFGNGGLNKTHGGYIGTTCLFRDAPAPASCVTCEAVPASMNPEALSCLECMYQRHILSHYKKMITGGSQGNWTVFPVCGQEPKNGCRSQEESLCPSRSTTPC